MRSAKIYLQYLTISYGRSRQRSEQHNWKERQHETAKPLCSSCGPWRVPGETRHTDECNGSPASYLEVHRLGSHMLPTSKQCMSSLASFQRFSTGPSGGHVAPWCDLLFFILLSRDRRKSRKKRVTTACADKTRWKWWPWKLGLSENGVYPQMVLFDRNMMINQWIQRYPNWHSSKEKATASFRVMEDHQAQATTWKLSEWNPMLSTKLILFLSCAWYWLNRACPPTCLLSHVKASCYGTQVSKVPRCAENTGSSWNKEFYNTAKRKSILPQHPGPTRLLTLTNSPQKSNMSIKILIWRFPNPTMFTKMMALHSHQDEWSVHGPKDLIY